MKSIEKDIEHINQIPIIPNLLEVICQTTGMGFAAVARVTDDRWVTCSVKDDILFGLLPGSELKLETTICNEIRLDHKAVVIDHVEKDEHFRAHHTPLMYGFQSYISIPIFRRGGEFFGTLCAIDPKPHQLNTPAIIGMFNLFADLISFHLQAIEQVSIVETQLAEEYKTAELREQFIGILGHDLRNPLSAITFSSELLLDMPLDNEAMSLVNIIRKSSGRMAGLIKNILDFARGRMGGGLMLNRSKDEALEPLLQHIIKEIQASNPDRIIKTNIDLIKPVYCDGNRIGELLSNLLGNAITYGDKQAPVFVDAVAHNGEFILSVRNEGEKIPDQMMGKLFEPFVRGESRSGKDGLGLGLFIASEIARAHEGKIDVSSNDSETIFTLKIPNHPA